MRTGHFTLLASAILVIAGCGAKEDVASAAKETMSGDVAAAAPEAQRQGVALKADTSIDGAGRAPATRLASNSTFAPHTNDAASVAEAHRQIIRNGDLAIRVKQIEPAERQIENLIATERGYVDSASSTDLASDHPQIKISLRVPENLFESTLTTIESMGVRLSKTVNSQDVTGQLIDLDARVTTMKDEEKTYQNLLGRSNNLETAMQLRDKLTELRSQIESIAGQRKSMGELAALSTISVTLSQSAVAGAPPQDATWLQETWGQSSSFALAGARVVGGFAVWFVTLTPFWLPLVLVARRFIAKAKAENATSSSRVSTIL